MGNDESNDYVHAYAGALPFLHYFHYFHYFYYIIFIFIIFALCACRCIAIVASVRACVKKLYVFEHACVSVLSFVGAHL